MITHNVDLTSLPPGQTYEDRYGGYIAFFKRIAETPRWQRIVVNNAPWSWVPLLRWLRCDIETPRAVFEHCDYVKGAMSEASANHAADRTLIEVLCGFRPETTDALWKADMEWQTDRADVDLPRKEFIVTTNGAYHRPEVKNFMRRLEMYTPTKRNALLVPCAADKPYPAPLHKACLELMPADFYMMNATGVVGLVPQDLWPVMPWYDSGMPNEWRLYQTAKDYFSAHQHDRVVVYCDYYSEPLQDAFDALRMLDRVSFVLPVIHYNNYQDLLSEKHLKALAGKLGTNV